MAKVTKNKKAALAKLEAGKIYGLPEATELVKAIAFMISVASGKP